MLDEKRLLEAARPALCNFRDGLMTITDLVISLYYIEGVYTIHVTAIHDTEISLCYVGEVDLDGNADRVELTVDISEL